jgi:hypothetical protein
MSADEAPSAVPLEDAERWMAALEAGLRLMLILADQAPTLTMRVRALLAAQVAVELRARLHDEIARALEAAEATGEEP